MTARYVPLRAADGSYSFSVGYGPGLTLPAELGIDPVVTFIVRDLDAANGYAGQYTLCWRWANGPKDVRFGPSVTRFCPADRWSQVKADFDTESGIDRLVRDAITCRPRRAA